MASNQEVMTVMYNSLLPSDDIWWPRSGSTLAQVMACCLTAPSHNLHQCWLAISGVLWHSPKGNFIWTSQESNSSSEFVWKLHFENSLHIPKSHWIDLSPITSQQLNTSCFLTLGLFGRRVIVVTCVCPSVRLSVCLSVCSHHPC